MVEVKKMSKTKTKPNVLTDGQRQLLKNTIDIDSVSESKDNSIVEAVKKLNLDKDLVIEYLILFARGLEREINYTNKYNWTNI